MADSKAKYWVGILYPENMIDNWQEAIYHTIQLPFSYCIHDKDLIKDTEDTSRKKHVHLIICFPNTTTYKHALDVFKRLGSKSVNKVEQILNIQYMYNYLIHDTEKARKDGKYLYNAKERIEGNNFDIGCFIQEDLSAKLDKIIELTNIIFKKQFTNYMRFFNYVVDNLDKSYLDCVLKNKSHFQYYCKGVYQDLYFNDKIKELLNNAED